MDDFENIFTDEFREKCRSNEKYRNIVIGCIAAAFISSELNKIHNVLYGDKDEDIL